MSFFKAYRNLKSILIKKVEPREVQPQTNYFVIRRSIPGKLLSSRARFRFDLLYKCIAILGHRFKCKRMSGLLN